MALLFSFDCFSLHPYPDVPPAAGRNPSVLPCCATAGQCVTVVQLQHAAREAHVLGIAADRLPGASQATPATQPTATAVKDGASDSGAVLQRVAAQTEVAALEALLRLACGTHAQLRYLHQV